ncbi:alpha/beta-Hydrolases superfamily protein [Euphorbia peplus]|nr:alpha/beta-Hydrolases superfamily protein [Euphorbia peplus]
MDSTRPKILYECLPLFRAYEDGSIDRFIGEEFTPPSLETHIRSKDVVVSPQLNLSSRLYLPKNVTKKLPLVLYFHGGGFCIYNPFHPTFHAYHTKLAEEANVLIVAVNYRKAPENPLPAAYNDAWTALQWVDSHSNGDGPEEWINCHADLGQVYAAGDSAGANVAHNLGMRFGVDKLSFGGVNLVGLVIVHSFFWGKEAIDGETRDPKIRATADGLWNLTYPNASGGSDHPAVNPGMDPNLSKLGCKKVLVLVAEKDELLKRRQWFYYENLIKCGWEGSVEIMETKDEEHDFHININPNGENAAALMKTIASFLNQSS